MPCLIPGCDNPAPFGYGWPGHRKDKPDGKRGQIHTCLAHRDEGERRYQAALDADRPAGATDMQPQPGGGKALRGSPHGDGQGSLF